MLKIITSMKELDFGQLVSVYDESICKDGAENYRNESENVQYLRAKQDFYTYLNIFFSQKDSMLCVWVAEGNYKAALRLEPYRDGALLAGLETAPEVRRMGFAKRLVDAVVDKVGNSVHLPLYSHVDKSNFASVSLHNACGFEKILDYGVYSDGSVFYDSVTFCKMM